MWYIHTMDYNSAIKKNKIMPFVATWMEIRKKDKYNIISSTCGILKKKKRTNELTNRNRLTDLEK